MENESRIHHDSYYHPEKNKFARRPVGPEYGSDQETRDCSLGDPVLDHVFFSGEGGAFKVFGIPSTEVTRWSIDLINCRIPKGYTNLHEFKEDIKRRLGEKNYNTIKNKLERSAKK